ncbi:Uma2 family endonuclease [Acaryochloris sp. CCMEE 5410]|uniref:Uma2 family endonuclease n=1 Tax=Acaryochloris sp. CCMEE 5410 TaxID=310037 RepID=UPI0002484DD4|nr:Uma2 family endonuclease [Acaryochloris sp. CCMEE 5410]KAI9132003.1 Uma2 family endonuclease [Acaryochloris sp. CCMEE 5410]
MVNVPVKIPQTLYVTDEQFLELVRANPDLRMERTAQGEVIIMSPTGSEGGNRNAEFTIDLGIWNRRKKLGMVFDSSTGFKLPNGNTRAPDTAWVKQERWDALTPEQRMGFAPICPDFVLELASETDDIEVLQAKMQEYLDNGCSLGWLINPKTLRVEIYRPNRMVEVLHNPKTLSGGETLPDFELKLNIIFSRNT